MFTDLTGTAFRLARWLPTNHHIIVELPSGRVHQQQQDGFFREGGGGDEMTDC